MIRNLLSQFTFFFQLFSSAVVLFSIYMIAALLTNIEFDMVAGIGLLIFQPIVACLLILATFFICLLFGLPLRKSKKIAKWWKDRQFIPVAGVFVAFLFLIMSFLPAFTTVQQVQLDEEVAERSMPNGILGSISWFLLAFCMLHFYPLSLIDNILSWHRKRRVRHI